MLPAHLSGAAVAHIIEYARECGGEIDVSQVRKHLCIDEEHTTDIVTLLVANGLFHVSAENSNRIRLANDAKKIRFSDYDMSLRNKTRCSSYYLINEIFYEREKYILSVILGCTLEELSITTNEACNS